MVQGVTFDLDGVYFPNGKRNFLRSLEQLGVAPDEARRVFLQSENMNHVYKHGQMSDHQFWTWAAREWKLDMTPQALIDLLIDGYDVDSRVAETVRRIRSRGLKTLICSNNFPARVTGLQKKYQFLNDFDVAVFSYNLGTSKPDEKIFAALVEQSGLPAGSIVFADDDDNSLAGAKKIGITTVLFSTYDQFIIDLANLGVPVQ